MKSDHAVSGEYTSGTHSRIYTNLMTETSTYDHTHWRIRDPVRSPIDKPVRARLVVGWVTTSESLVLYVFVVLFWWFLSGNRGSVDKCRGCLFLVGSGIILSCRFVAHVIG